MTELRLAQGYYEDASTVSGIRAWRPLRGVGLNHGADEDGPDCLLTRAVMYVDEQGGKHIAERGEHTDGGSKPRLTWVLFGHPYDVRFLRCYVVHDAENKAAVRAARIAAARGWELRAQADITFREGVTFRGRELVRKARVDAGRKDPDAFSWTERLAVWNRAAAYYRAVRANAWWERMRPPRDT